MRPFALILRAALALMPATALAHPHVFIDAGLTLDHDSDGALRAVEVEWAYDAFYSLLIIEDLGLDPDGDGVLTASEEAALQGFDSDWEPGFDGRLYLDADGAPVALHDAQDFRARYQDGRLISGHTRPLTAPLPGDQALRIRVYDPEYYVQFAIPEPPLIARADCRADLRIGDPYAAADAYARAVAEAVAKDPDLGAQQEVLVVDIGAVGADEVLVTCGAAP